MINTDFMIVAAYEVAEQKAKDAGLKLTRWSDHCELSGTVNCTFSTVDGLYNFLCGYERGYSRGRCDTLTKKRKK